MKLTYIDDEEKEIIESLHHEEYESVMTPHLLDKYAAIAENTIAQNKELSISISQKDIDKIKAKAIGEGVGYQQLIAMLVHKYNEGQVVFR